MDSALCKDVEDNSAFTFSFSFSFSFHFCFVLFFSVTCLPCTKTLQHSFSLFLPLPTLQKFSTCLCLSEVVLFPRILLSVLCCNIRKRHCLVHFSSLYLSIYLPIYPSLFLSHTFPRNSCVIIRLGNTSLVPASLYRNVNVAETIDGSTNTSTASEIPLHATTP
jgi:hypothetical protein